LKLLLLQISILQLTAGCGASAPTASASSAAPPPQIDAAAKMAVVQAVSDGGQVEFALAGPHIVSITDLDEPAAAPVQ
jgi:hypothetical protein